jgi:hypothetical protein
MTSINQLCFDDTPALGDQVVLYPTVDGIARRTSINTLLAVINQLPTVQPVTGSGELWLNNGVLTVA